MNAASHIWAGEETETPWRFRLQEMAWRDLVDALKHDDLPFVGLWCDGTDVHALFLPDGQPLAATLALEDGRYPALSPARDISCLYERRIYDLYGAEGMWATDVRPLLDHDVWSSSTPLAEHPGAGGGKKGLSISSPLSICTKRVIWQMAGAQPQAVWNHPCMWRWPCKKGVFAQRKP